MQVVPIGTILLTVKRNNYKTPLLEAVSNYILQEYCSSNTATNL